MSTSGTSEHSDLEWIKSSASLGTGACLEFARRADGRIALRNSRDPDVVMLFTREEVHAFLAGARHGEFDHLVDGPTDPATAPGARP